MSNTIMVSMQTIPGDAQATFSRAMVDFSICFWA